MANQSINLAKGAIIVLPMPVSALTARLTYWLGRRNPARSIPFASAVPSSPASKFSRRLRVPGEPFGKSSVAADVGLAQSSRRNEGLMRRARLALQKSWARRFWSYSGYSGGAWRAVALIVAPLVVIAGGRAVHVCRGEAVVGKIGIIDAKVSGMAIREADDVFGIVERIRPRARLRLWIMP